MREPGRFASRQADRAREPVQNSSAFLLRLGVEPGTVWHSKAAHEPDDFTEGCM